MASLHKQPGKPFWFCAYSSRDAQGRLKRHFRSTGTADKRQACEIGNAWVRASTRGARLTPDEARRIIAQGVADVLAVGGESLPSATIRQWCDRWLQVKSVEAETRTHEKYKACVASFLRFLGNRADRDLGTLRPDDIQKFRDDRAKQVATATANLELKIVRACLSGACKVDLLTKNVAAVVPVIKQRGANRRRAFTLEEIQRVLRQCDEVGGEWRGLVLAGLYTGQRLGDVARLTWQQVNLARSEIAFVTEKTGKRLCLNIAAPLRDYFEQAPSADAPDAYVFPTLGAVAEKRVGTLSNRFYDHVLAPAGLVPARPKKHTARLDGRDAKRQLSELSFHSLRHTLTSWLKIAGASNALAQAIVGHDSEAVSRSYTHFAPDDMASALSKLPDVTASAK